MTVLLLILATTALDQFTKLLIMRNFELGQSIPVIPGFFNLTYVRNTGAAFGTFGGLNNALALISIVVLVLLAVYHRRMMGNTPVRELSLALLSAGILGNLFDRLRLNYVVDFLDFYRMGTHFPSFNIADSSICIGVALYAISVVLFHRQAQQDATPSQGAPTT